MDKLERFKYISDYYIQLLEMEMEFKKKGIKYISIGVENNKTTTTGKCKLADDIFNKNFKFIIEGMISETEKELIDFLKI